MLFLSRALFLLVLVCRPFGLCSHHRRVGGSISILFLCSFHTQHTLAPHCSPHTASFVHFGPVLCSLASEITMPPCIRVQVAQIKKHRPSSLLHIMRCFTTSRSLIAKVISKTEQYFAFANWQLSVHWTEEYRNILHHFLSGPPGHLRSRVALTEVPR